MAAVSAVVVSYHSGPCLERCLDLLARDPLVGEVIVVDNGNPEAVLEGLRARPALTLITGHGNVGFAQGCNLGAARAREAYLAFVNPDIEIEPETVPALLAAGAGAARTPWLVGARIVWPDGREQRGGRRDRITLWNALVSAAGLGRLERFSPLFRDPHREGDPVPEAPIAVGAVSGALMAMPADAFRTLGGFDGGYRLHVEDIDLCRRVWEAGGTVLFAPGARAVHIRSTSSISPLRVEIWKAQGFLRYFSRPARGPAGRVLAVLAAAPIAAALIGRGLYRRLTRR